jgi:hypothetical protein
VLVRLQPVVAFGATGFQERVLVVSLPAPDYHLQLASTQAFDNRMGSSSTSPIPNNYSHYTNPYNQKAPSISKDRISYSLGSRLEPPAGTYPIPDFISFFDVKPFKYPASGNSLRATTTCSLAITAMRNARLCSICMTGVKLPIPEMAGGTREAGCSRTNWFEYLRSTQ